MGALAAGDHGSSVQPQSRSLPQAEFMLAFEAARIEPGNPVGDLILQHSLLADRLLALYHDRFYYHRPAQCVPRLEANLRCAPAAPPSGLPIVRIVLPALLGSGGRWSSCPRWSTSEISHASRVDADSSATDPLLIALPTETAK